MNSYVKSGFSSASLPNFRPYSICPATDLFNAFDILAHRRWCYRIILTAIGNIQIPFFKDYSHSNHYATKRNPLQPHIALKCKITFDRTLDLQLNQLLLLNSWRVSIIKHFFVGLRKSNHIAQESVPASIITRRSIPNANSAIRWNPKCLRFKQ